MPSPYRRVQQIAKRGLKIVAGVGDSLTYASGTRVRPDEHYPKVLVEKLRAKGCASVRDRNFGISGNTSDQVLARIHKAYKLEYPDLAIIWTGANDGGVGATTTAKLKDIARCLRGSPQYPTLTASASGGSLATGSYNYKLTTIDVAGNESYPGPAANADAAVTGPTGSVLLAWNPVRDAAGYKVYGRTSSGYGLIATLDADATSFVDVGGKTTGAAPPTTNASTIGCKRIIILGHFYINLATGADTVGTPNSGNALLRAAQQQAVTDLVAQGYADIVFGDQYAVMRQRVVDGLDLQASSSWHITTSDSHLNPKGQSIVADTLLATIMAQSGWLSALAE